MHTTIKHKEYNWYCTTLKLRNFIYEKTVLRVWKVLVKICVVSNKGLASRIFKWLQFLNMKMLTAQKKHEPKSWRSVSQMANENMKMPLASLAKEMPMETTTLSRMAIIQKADNSKSNNVELLEIRHTAHGSINWYKNFGKVLEVSIKAEYRNTYESAILFDYRETHTYVHQKTYVRKFIANCSRQILKLIKMSITGQMDKTME